MRTVPPPGPPSPILPSEIASVGEELLAVHEALDQLARHDPRKAEPPGPRANRAESVVKLRYFAGLSFEETAEVLGISVPTAKRDWAYARAWLQHEIGLG